MFSQIWIKTYFVKLLFYIKKKKNCTVQFIDSNFLKWFHFCNNLLIVFKQRPTTLGLYSKAFMNYNNWTLNSALSSLFKKRGGVTVNGLIYIITIIKKNSNNNNYNNNIGYY